MENNNFVQNQPTPPVQPPVQNAPQQQPYAPQPQQPYGQPGYPQQPYAPQQPRESIIDKLYGKAASSHDPCYDTGDIPTPCYH